MTTIDKLLKNAEALASDLMECPANEQHIAKTQAMTAQAIRDLAQAIRMLQMVTR